MKEIEAFNIEGLKFDRDGLIPSILQEANTGEVLMLAYMNQEALEKTLQTKETWFWSRSRQVLWNKGATSGNKQQVQSISYDCDGDTLLIKVLQEGNACHTGEKSCFFNKIYGEQGQLDEKILHQLMNTIEDRRKNPKEGSYTNYLLNKGLDKILKKVGEEGAEVIIAAKNADPQELINEVSDLVYHLLVLLSEKTIGLEEIKRELIQREGIKS